MYVLSGVIQLLALFKMWLSHGKKMFNEIVSESKIEEWLKLVVNEMRRIFRK